MDNSAIELLRGYPTHQPETLQRLAMERIRDSYERFLELHFQEVLNDFDELSYLLSDNFQKSLNEFSPLVWQGEADEIPCNSEELDNFISQFKVKEAEPNDK